MTNQQPSTKEVLNRSVSNYFRAIGARGGKTTAARGHNANLFTSETAKRAAARQWEQVQQARASDPQGWKHDGKRWRRVGK